MGGGSAVASLNEAGMRMVKVEPSPGVLSTETSPPIIWQIFRVIARPRPVPPYLRVVEASAWVKAWNSRPTCSGGHADAGVADAEDDPVAVGPRLAGDVQADGPVPGELAGVRQQVEQALAEPGRVGEDRAEVPVLADLQEVVVPGRQGLDDGRDLADQAANAEDSPAGAASCRPRSWRGRGCR